MKNQIFVVLRDKTSDSYVNDKKNYTFRQWRRSHDTLQYSGLISGHGHYNLMDVSLQSPVMDPSTMKLLYPHQQHHPSNPLSLGLTGFTPMGMGQGMQAFVDPTYYDDIDKLFMEFTREVHPQQLENLDSGNFSPHQYSGES